MTTIIVFDSLSEQQVQHLRTICDGDIACDSNEAPHCLEFSEAFASRVKSQLDTWLVAYE